MRTVITTTLALLLAGCSSTQTADAQRCIDNEVVEASCGQCQLGLTDPPGCDLAIRLNDEVYLVDGAHIDDFGDAHAADGFCQSIRTARVTGTIENGRFHATAFELVSSDEQ